MGGLVGVLGGVVAQVAIPAPGGSDIVALMRVALLFPVAVFASWWLTSPGLARHRQLVETSAAPDGAVAGGGPTSDDTAGVAGATPVESTFDSAAIPAAGRQQRDAASPELERFRSSIRPRTVRADGPREAAFSVRRPEPAPIASPLLPDGAAPPAVDGVDDAFARRA